jgi:putative flavoprotein involved in K+ transport
MSISSTYEADARIRTADPFITSEVLYQLSYVGLDRGHSSPRLSQASRAVQASSMTGERVDTVVIGAGQAGLASSYLLKQRGREHVVLEQGRIGDTWRTQRWDGFHLNTPNWGQRLPGHHYEGPAPDAFAPLADVIAYLEGYARDHDAPVRTGVRVTGLRPEADGWRVTLDGDELRAVNVVVATGAFQKPHLPNVAKSAPGEVLELHTSDYRRPEQLPAGGVLIVGSGQSGCQIADELLRAGRKVYLSVGRCPWLPRRYRGHDVLHWLLETGLADQTADSLPTPEARLACNPAVSGDDGGHDCNPRWLAERGAVLAGRVEAIDAHRVVFASDLDDNLAKGDEFVATLVARIDEHTRAAGLELPEESLRAEPRPPARVEALDLREAGVGTILWASGFRPDFGWIEAPVFDGEGRLLQTRGVSVLPGLYFVGLHWLHKRKSALFVGVGEDAEHVVSRLDTNRPGA